MGWGWIVSFYFRPKHERQQGCNIFFFSHRSALVSATLSIWRVECDSMSRFFLATIHLERRKVKCPWRVLYVPATHNSNLTKLDGGICSSILYTNLQKWKVRVDHPYAQLPDFVGCYEISSRKSPLTGGGVIIPRNDAAFRAIMWRAWVTRVTIIAPMRLDETYLEQRDNVIPLLRYRHLALSTKLFVHLLCKEDQLFLSIVKIEGNKRSITNKRVT